MTTATISPAKVTRSVAIGGWAGATWSVVIGQALIITPIESSRSAPEKTVTTLGAALAAEVSTEVMVACANGLRTIAMCSMPGSVMLSVQRVRPVISRWSSLRRRSRPISLMLAGASCVAVISDLDLLGLGLLGRGAVLVGVGDLALGCGLHGPDDVVVTRAPAQIALETVADLFLGRV